MLNAYIGAVVNYKYCFKDDNQFSSANDLAY